MTDQPMNILSMTRALAKISTPKVQLWRFQKQSTFEAVFAPLVSKLKNDTKFSLPDESKKSSPPIIHKMKNKFITYNDTAIVELDNSVYGKIKRACTCRYVSILFSTIILFRFLLFLFNFIIIKPSPHPTQC